MDEETRRYLVENFSVGLTALYNFRAEYGKGVFGCLEYNEEYKIPDVTSFAERFLRKDWAVGNRLLKATLGSDKEINETFFSYITELIESDQAEIIETKNLIVDYRLLNKPEVLNFLNQLHSKGLIRGIRISGDDFVLDEDTYNKISFLEEIKVSKSNIERDNIREFGEFQIIAGYGDDGPISELIIRKNLSDKEINEIVDACVNINGDEINKISLRFYNPVVETELIERLDKAGLNPNTEIDILGYTLTEKPDLFKRILEIGKRRKINVNYVCCHDLLNDYCHEPFAVNNSYRSELEPGGKTSIDIYYKILQFVDDFEKSVKGVESTSEKIMMAYQFIRDRYGYAVNAGRDKDYGATRDIDKILTEEEIVCVGFANLLTLLCRRVEIPMFTYGAPGHLMNVARVIEKDKQGNAIFDKICTFDLTNDANFFDMVNGERIKYEKPDSYTYFGIDPALWLYDNETSFLTLGNMLAVAPSDVEKYLYSSKSDFNMFYSGGYTSESYAYSMLRLMGYSLDNVADIPDVIAQLQAEDRIGEIPDYIIYETARSIERKKYRDMSEEEFNNHMAAVNNRIKDSLDYRNKRFSKSTPKILLNFGDGNEVEVSTYHQRLENTNEIDLNKIDHGPIYFDDLSDLPSGNNPINEQEENKNTPSHNPNFGNYIAGTTIRKPRDRGIYESDEEYINYLREYYDKYFPKAAKYSDSVYGLTKNQIIQDLPIYSKEKQTFNAQAMTDEEVEEHRRLL